VIAAAGLASAASGQSIVTNLPGTFIDISPAGTNQGTDSTAHGDDVYAAIPVNFGNSFVPAGTMQVGSNGILLQTTAAGFTNAALANLSPGVGYYPYWDDLRSDNAGPPPGTIYYANLADRTVIQWNNIGTFAGGTGTGTFEIQIFNGPSGPGGSVAQFLYNDVDFGGTGSFGASATIGIVDTGTGFAQYSFNVANAVVAGTVVSILPAPASLALLGLGGLMAGRRRRA
jgi:hypothetical protein